MPCTWCACAASPGVPTFPEPPWCCVPRSYSRGGFLSLRPAAWRHPIRRAREVQGFGGTVASALSTRHSDIAALLQRGTTTTTTTTTTVLPGPLPVILSVHLDRSTILSPRLLPPPHLPLSTHLPSPPLPSPLPSPPTPSPSHPPKPYEPPFQTSAFQFALSSQPNSASEPSGKDRAPNGSVGISRIASRDVPTQDRPPPPQPAQSWRRGSRPSKCPHTRSGVSTGRRFRSLCAGLPEGRDAVWAVSATRASAAWFFLELSDARHELGAEPVGCGIERLGFCQHDCSGFVGRTQGCGSPTTGETTLVLEGRSRGNVFSYHEHTIGVKGRLRPISPESPTRAQPRPWEGFSASGRVQIKLGGQQVIGLLQRCLWSISWHWRIDRWQTRDRQRRA